jgi:hypothetical protein
MEETENTPSFNVPNIRRLTTADITVLTTEQIAALNPSTNYNPANPSNWSTLTLGGGIGAIGSSSGTYYATGSFPYNTFSNNNNSSGKIQLTGDNADVEINGVSLKKTLDDINSRLNILQPNVKLEEEWQELKTLGDQYRALEKDLEEKSKMWQVLKTPLPEEN